MPFLPNTKTGFHSNTGFSVPCPSLRFAIPGLHSVVFPGILVSLLRSKFAWEASFFDLSPKPSHLDCSAGTSHIFGP